MATPINKPRITVRRVSTSYDRAWKATLHTGSSSVGYYADTAEAAEARLRENADCEGIEATYEDGPLIPIAQHPWATGRPYEELVEDENYKINDDGIIEDIDLTNKLLANEREYEPYALSGKWPTSGEISVTLLVVAMVAIAWSL